MKRCPTCNRLETDDALAFCRVDGSPLAEAPSEVETSLLPHAVTDPDARRAGPTTVLSLSDPAPSTSQLSTAGVKPAKRVASTRNSVIAGAIGFLLVTALAVGSYLKYGRSDDQIESIAVMPFVNESGNADVDYLSDGMAETLINSLSQLPQLSVKARSSVFRYKGKDLDPQTVGSQLNVEAILNGRVVQRGDDLTLYLSLVETRTGNQLWGEQYKRRQSDLLALQTEISRDVATKLKTRLTGAEEQKVAKNYTQNAEAYQLYLQGRYFWNKRTPETLRKSIEYFRQAIDKDPSYALGYAGLSDAYILLAYYGVAPAEEVLPKAREAALKALAMDDGLAEAHNALGFVLGFYDYDYAESERQYRRVLQINPNYTQAHQNLGVMLNRLGRHEEGIAEIRRALEIEPLSIIVNRLYGDALFGNRRFDEALTQFKKTLELDPTFPTTHLSISGFYQATGKYAESVESFAKYQELSGRPESAKFVRESFSSGSWQGYLREMTGPRRPPGVAHFVAATYFAELGDKDNAFAELEKSLTNREYLLLYIKIDPRLDSLRSDSRLQTLIRRMRFPE